MLVKKRRFSSNEISSMRKILTGLISFKRDENQQEFLKFELVYLRNIFTNKHEILTIDYTDSNF